MMSRNPIGLIRQAAIQRRGYEPAMQEQMPNRWSPQAEDEMGGVWGQQQQEPQDNASRYYQEMQRIQSEASPGISSYRAALQNQPKMEEYAPSGWTRAAAGLSGFSAGLKDAGKGIAVAQGLNRSNYVNAMDEYSTRLGTLQEQARMEEADKRSRLEALYKAQSTGLDYLKYLQDVKHTANADAAAGRTADARMISAEAARANAAKTDWDYTVVQGGIQAVNKNDPSQTRLIPVKTVQDAQNEVARGNLAVAQGNLKVNQAQLPIQQQNANTASQNMMINEQNMQRENELAPRRVAAQELTAGTVRAPEQKAAFDLAEQEMMNEQEWSRFFGTNWRGKPLGPQDFTPEEWKLFQDELQDRTSHILANPRRK